MAGNVGVYRHREAKVVVRLVKVVKVVFPEIFDYAGMDPAVGIGHVLNEHLEPISVSQRTIIVGGGIVISTTYHGWKVIQVPAGRNLDKACGFAADQRLHPCVWVFLVVDVGPGITDAQPVWQGVVV